MEENIIMYPRFYNCGTEQNFKDIEDKICDFLGFPDNTNTLDYADPIIDNNDTYWIIINQEVTQTKEGKEPIFTEAEILAMVQFDDIKLPEVK